MEKTLRNRTETLLEALSDGVLEREEAIGLALLSAIAGESIFLLGLPGVAKSLIARRLALALRDARRFEYLMSRFSTPDEIFGPVSISKLKDADTYERLTDGYLPTADVAFLDEIWKAGPAIQNSLLTALNEKTYRNGREDIALPLKAIIAASNELPAEGEGLEALWDRFLVRYIVEPIRDKGNFLTLLMGRTVLPCRVPRELQFSSEEMEAMLRERDSIDIPEEVLEFLYAIRTRYGRKAQEQLKDRAAAKADGEQDVDGEESVPYISDRRWKKIAGLLRTSALLNGRDTVDWSDCLLLEHLIWDDDTQLALIRDDLAKELTVHLLKGSASAGGKDRWKSAPEPETASLRFWSPDGGVHYAFEAGGEQLLIAAEDYARLGEGSRQGRFGEDGTILLTDGPGEFTIRRVKPGTVTIGSFSYPLRLEGSVASRAGNFLSEVIAFTGDRIDAFREAVDANLFTRPMEGYRTLTEELRRYRSAVRSAKPSR